MESSVLMNRITIEKGKAIIPSTLSPEATTFLAEFMRCILLCNSIVVDNDKYKCDSPDELCLVHYCKELGGELLDKKGLSVEININGVNETWQVEKTLEFSSERKRMSVLAYSEELGRSVLYSKGADDMILSRSVKSGTLENVDMEKNFVDMTACLREYADTGYVIE